MGGLLKSNDKVVLEKLEKTCWARYFYVLQRIIHIYSTYTELEMNAASAPL